MFYKIYPNKNNLPFPIIVSIIVNYLSPTIAITDPSFIKAKSFNFYPCIDKIDFL